MFLVVIVDTDPGPFALDTFSAADRDAVSAISFCQVQLQKPHDDEILPLLRRAVALLEAVEVIRASYVASQPGRAREPQVLSEV